MADAPPSKPEPDKTDPDAAGEGWSPEGDAWYHRDLLGTDEEDDAKAREMSKAKGWY